MFKAKVKHREPQAKVLYVNDTDNEDNELAIDVLYKRKRYGGHIPRIKAKINYGGE